MTGWHTIFSFFFFGGGVVPGEDTRWCDNNSHSTMSSVCYSIPKDKIERGRERWLECIAHNTVLPWVSLRRVGDGFLRTEWDEWERDTLSEWEIKTQREREKEKEGERSTTRRSNIVRLLLTKQPRHDPFSVEEDKIVASGASLPVCVLLSDVLDMQHSAAGTVDRIRYKEYMAQQSKNSTDRKHSIVRKSLMYLIVL